MDRTCGTCAHNIIVDPKICSSGICFKSDCIHYNEDTDVARLAYPLHANETPACEHYTERTDLVEQVAKDMLAFIGLNEVLRNQTIRGQAKPVDKIFNYEKFKDRLSALGVEVDD